MTFKIYIRKSSALMGYVIQSACVAHCIVEYVGSLVMCSGPSMEPTLETNNILITEQITPRMQRLRRGDIITARCPTDPKQNICKRVTGLPGDRVKGDLLIGSVVVPRGHVWLEGDNTNNSKDSRMFGPVPQALIFGRVLCRVWPLDKMGSLSVS